MTHAALEELLKRTMGLDAATIGSASIERAVQARILACKLDHVQAYLHHVQTSSGELQELIEAVVVPETSFFRDSEAFAALVRVVRDEWLPAHPQGLLRLLSLPCSTGEEPYSLAMALLDAGLLPERFHVDAVDISKRVIAYAERGVYGKNSFRSQELGFRDRYFKTLQQGYRVADNVRAQVRFQHGNMLTSGWLPSTHAYDVIFCRNVLIYFDRPTQDRAVEVLSRLLTQHGILFVGPSEASLLLDHRFVTAGFALAFGFRRPEMAQAGKKQRHELRVKPLPVRRPRPPPAVVPKPAPAPPPVKPVATEQEWIAEAQRLANEGKLNEAMQYSERHFRDHPASAGGFYLIGLLHDAAGHPQQAAEHYRKALYLNPKHGEALVHLAMALEKAGDATGAHRLLGRAKRQTL